MALALKDNYLNKVFNLPANTTYDFQINGDPNSKGDKRFEIILKKSATGVKELITKENSFYAFPNPASTVINLSLTANQTGNYQYELINELGQQLEKGNIDFGSSRNYSLNIESLQTGVYFIKVYNSSSNQTIKFIK